MSCLVLGGTGLLGNHFVTILKKKKIRVFKHGNSKPSEFNFELSDEKSLTKILKKYKPKIIINCAALTNVDLCNENFGLAYRNNALSVRYLIKSIKSAKIRPHLTYISTDQVYNNQSKTGSNKESDFIISNNYGKSKFFGEVEMKNYSKSLIIRTNFFGESKLSYRKSFSDWLILNAQKRNKIFLAKNIFFNPIHLNYLTELVLELINKNCTGIFNVGSKDCISKYEFAKLIFRRKKIKNKCLHSYVNSIAKNKRPNGTFMNIEKLQNKLNIKIPNLKDSINQLS